MNFEYISQGFASGIALGVFVIVFGWIGHSVFFGINTVSESRPVWSDDQ